MYAGNRTNIFKTGHVYIYCKPDSSDVCHSMCIYGHFAYQYNYICPRTYGFNIFSVEYLKTTGSNIQTQIFKHLYYYNVETCNTCKSITVQSVGQYF